MPTHMNRTCSEAVVRCRADVKRDPQLRALPGCRIPAVGHTVVEGRAMQSIVRATRTISRQS